jgi:RNA polymerase sigma-70 factor (ECF subfamily)
MAARRPAARVSPEDAEERLLVGAAQKDPAKFGDLYELHFDRIYAFVARRARDRATAEDLTSEVFRKALANLRNYEWRGAPFAAWLIRIAAHAVADQFTRAAREVPGAGDPPDDPPHDPPEPGGTPDMEAVEERVRLFRLVSRLPGDQRRVIFERFVEQRSIRDIAQQLGRTEGAVKQLQFRALRNLRAQMEGAHA